MKSSFFLFLLLNCSVSLASENQDTFKKLSTHNVYQIVAGRWKGDELNQIFPSRENYFVLRDFRIGPSKDGLKLIFESLIPGDNYVGIFSYYDEDCLQYDEYGYVQHLCMGPSGDVSWSGPCSAGSYRTRMTRAMVNNREVLKKMGDHWNHHGELHRKNSASFIRMNDTGGKF